MKHLRLLGAVLLLTGCDAVGCTLIGCINGLTIEFANAPAGAMTVEARSIDHPSAAVFTATCAGIAAVCTRVDFPDFLPRDVALTITTTAGTRRLSIRPTYTTSQPNGPKCGPTCRSARERVTW